MDEAQILDRETLQEAKEVLHSPGGDSLSRLAGCVCVLMSGFLDKLIEEGER